MLRLQAEVQNMSCHDILRDLIMAPVDVGLHIFQPNFLNSFSKQGVIAVHVLRSIDLIYLDPPRNPVVKTPQKPPNVRGHNPSLCAEEQVGLHYGEIKTH